MGTQRKIASTIVSQGADYLLAVKNNQPNLRAAVEDGFRRPVQGLDDTQRARGRVVVQHVHAIPNAGQVDPTRVAAANQTGPERLRA